MNISFPNKVKFFEQMIAAQVEVSHNKEDIKLYEIINSTSFISKEPKQNIKGEKIEKTIKQLVNIDQYTEATLHWAIIIGNIAFATHLIINGANLEVRDHNGYTPLQLAAKNKDLGILELLIAHGADIDVKDHEGCTLLHKAVINKDEEMIELLLFLGANIEARDDMGWAPLHYAAAITDTEIIGLLLSYDAEIDAQDNKGNTPLRRAVINIPVINGDIEAINTLINYGADMDIADWRGITPLHLAAGNGDIEIVKILIDRGADIEVINGKGYKPLHWAASLGQGEIADLLIDKGANTQALTFDGQTPTMLAYKERLKTLGDKLRSEPFETSWQTQNLLAARFGAESLIEVEGQYVKLGGIISNMAYPHLYGSFNTFFEDFSDVKSALQKAIDRLFLDKFPEEALANENMIVIPTGWEGHATTIVLAKDQKGEWLLFKCNRGEGDRAAFKPGVYVYRVGRPENLKEVLDRLIQYNSARENKDFFEKEMDTILKLKQKGFLSHKGQSHPNCGWASCKLALRALLYAHFKREDVENPAEKSREVYKEYSSKDRDLGWKEAQRLNDKQEINEELFFEISKKRNA